MLDLAEHKELIEWQRKLEPSNYVKATAAQYKTAPSIVLPNSPGYPDNLPKEAIVISFFIEGDDWLGSRKKVVVDHPLFAEKAPKSKKAKFGPVVILSDSDVLAVVAASENYYLAAYEMTKHPVLTATFVPGKDDDKGKFKVFCQVAFMPEYTGKDN